MYYFWKSNKIWKCRLLQIIFGALLVKTMLAQVNLHYVTREFTSIWIDWGVHNHPAVIYAEMSLGSLQSCTVTDPGIRDFTLCSDTTNGAWEVQNHPAVPNPGGVWGVLNRPAVTNPDGEFCWTPLSLTPINWQPKPWMSLYAKKAYLLWQGSIKFPLYITCRENS